MVINPDNGRIRRLRNKVKERVTLAKDRFSQWYDNNKNRLKRYGRNTLITGAAASFIASGVFFTKYFNNRSYIDFLQDQKQMYQETVDIPSSNYEGKKDISEVIDFIKEQKKNLQKPASSYTTKQGDSLSEIAMEYTGEKDLSWAKKKVNGTEMNNQEKATYKAYSELCKEAGKKNLFEEENWEKYGPSKGYPVEGPNLLETGEDLSLKNMPGYKESFNTYQNVKQQYDNKINQLKDTYQSLKQRFKNFSGKVKDKKSNLEEKLDSMRENIDEKLGDMKDNWKNLGLGFLFAAAPLGMLFGYRRGSGRRTRGEGPYRTKPGGNTGNPGGNAGNSGREGGNTSGEDEDPTIIDVEYTVNNKQNETRESSTLEHEVNNTYSGSNTGYFTGERPNYQNNETRAYSSNALRNPYRTTPDRETADKRLKVFEEYNKLWHDKYSPNGTKSQGSIIRQLENEFNISKSTIYKYINWVDSNLCSDSNDEITDYVREQGKNISKRLDKIDDFMAQRDTNYNINDHYSDLFIGNKAGPEVRAQ